MKQLEGLKDSFLKKLEEATIMYKTIGMSDDRESPMWFQLQVDEDDSSLLFKSSQSYVWMRIPCTKEEKMFVSFHYQEAYDYFKRLKYIHLRDNHPTVWEELGEVHHSRIEAFLKTGERFFGGKPSHNHDNQPVVKQSSLRKNILLILGIVMFVLTTALIVLIPQALVYKLDAAQWAILAIIMFMGYGSGTLYLMAHFAPEDKKF